MQGNYVATVSYGRSFRLAQVRIAEFVTRFATRFRVAPGRGPFVEGSQSKRAPSAALCLIGDERGASEAVVRYMPESTIALAAKRSFELTRSDERSVANGIVRRGARCQVNAIVVPLRKASHRC